MAANADGYHSKSAGAKEQTGLTAHWWIGKFLYAELVPATVGTERVVGLQGENDEHHSKLRNAKTYALRIRLPASKIYIQDAEPALWRTNISAWQFHLQVWHEGCLYRKATAHVSLTV